VFERVPTIGDLAHSANRPLQSCGVELSQMRARLMLHSADAALPRGDRDNDEFFGACHLLAPECTDSLRSSLDVQGVVLRRRCEDSAAACSELTPHTQLDLEVLLDQVVREVVRHEVVVTRRIARNQRGTVLALNGDPVPLVVDLREHHLHDTNVGSELRHVTQNTRVPASAAVVSTHLLAQGLATRLDRRMDVDSGILPFMSDKGQNGSAEPSLELPKLFGRKKQGAPYVAEPADEPTVVPPPEPEPVVEAGPEPVVESEWDEDREFKLPEIPGRVAAIITGLLVGLLGALLTWGSLEGCEQLRGTDSCGGEGFFLLLVILVLMILAGGLLLAAWDVSDPKSTSALGVGIVCVIVLLLLMEELLDGWMFLVVPVISALAYAVAQWVTTALVDEAELDTSPDSHDIR
jgi:hypothetical protein